MSDEDKKILKNFEIQPKKTDGSYRKAAANVAMNLVEKIMEQNEQFKNRFEFVDSSLRTLNQAHQTIIKEMKALGISQSNIHQELQTLRESVGGRLIAESINEEQQ